jgi:hypothetical protein
VALQERQVAREAYNDSGNNSEKKGNSVALQWRLVPQVVQLRREVGGLGGTIVKADGRIGWGQSPQQPRFKYPRLTRPVPNTRILTAESLRRARNRAERPTASMLCRGVPGYNIIEHNIESNTVLYIQVS